MNYWKSRVVSHYNFWVIVWTNIHTKISNPDIRFDIRRIIGLSSNFYQHFNLILYIHPASFRQIGWIWGNFIRLDFRPDIRISTKIARTLFWCRNMISWKFHVDHYHRFWVIVWTNKQTDKQTDKRDRKHYLSDFIGGGKNQTMCACASVCACVCACVRYGRPEF